MQNMEILSIVREAISSEKSGGVVIIGMIIIIVILIIYTFSKNVVSKWWLGRHLFIFYKILLEISILTIFDIFVIISLMVKRGVIIWNTNLGY